MKIFMGIDPSLTGTGVVLLNEEGEVLDRGSYCSSKDLEHTGRFEEIALFVEDFINDWVHVPDFYVMIEAPSFMSKGPTITLAQLNGYIAGRVRRLVPVVYQLPPTSLKKFFTMNGKATKTQMHKTARAKYGFDCKDNNQVDAFALAIAVEALVEGSVSKPTKELITAAKGCSVKRC